MMKIFHKLLFSLGIAFLINCSCNYQKAIILSVNFLDGKILLGDTLSITGSLLNWEEDIEAAQTDTYLNLGGMRQMSILPKTDNVLVNYYVLLDKKTKQVVKFSAIMPYYANVCDSFHISIVTKKLFKESAILFDVEKLGTYIPIHSNYVSTILLKKDKNNECVGLSYEVAITNIKN